MTITDIYTSNIKLLKQNHPHVFNQLFENEFENETDYKTKVESTPSGKPNLIVVDDNGEDCFFHHPEDPEKEADDYLNIIDKETRGVAIFYGMGLGYGAMEVLKHRKGLQFIIIFELLKDVFIQALKSVDISPLLNSPKVIFSIGSSPDIHTPLNKAARVMRLEEVSLLNHIPSFEFNKKEYEKLSTDVYQVANQLNISSNTFKVYGSTFISNRLSALSMINHCSLIDSLAGKFKNIPAIIVAAGPSLEKNIHLLPKFKNKAVIIAVDSALPALLEKGIEPDFVTAIDYRDITFEKIASSSSKIKNISLICSSWVCKKVPKVFPAKNIFWTYTENPMEKWINKNLGGQVVSPGAGTVAHLNLVSSIIMGCSPVVFVGQDLSFPVDKAENDHVEGTIIRNENHIDKLMSNEQDIKWVKGNYEDKLPATRQFYGHLNEFEKMIQSNPGHYINATEGGAYIKGTEISTLENVFQKYCKKEQKIDEKINLINKTNRLNNIDSFLGEIKGLLTLVNKTKKIVENSQKNLIKAKAGLKKLNKTNLKIKNINDIPTKIQKDIQNLDKFNQKADNNQALWELFDEATMNELMLTDRMKWDIKLLEGNPDKYSEWLEKNLERLEEINKVRLNILSSFGNKLENITNHHKSEKELQDLLGHAQTDNDKADFHLKLARLYHLSEDYILSTPHLEKIFGLNQDDGEASFLMGKIFSFQNNFKKADIFFQNALEKNYDKYLKEIQLFKENLSSEYLNHALFAQDISTATCKYMTLKGLDFHLENKDLIKILETFLTQEIELLESIEDHTSDQFYNIIQEWEKTFEKFPQLPKKIDTDIVNSIYKLKGVFYAESGELMSSFEYLNKALSIDQNDPESKLLLSDLLFLMGHNQLGLQYFQEALELDPGFVQNYQTATAPDSPQTDINQLLNQGNIFFSNKELNKALETFETALKIAPDNPDAIHNLGVVHKALGNVEKAANLYQETIEKDPLYYHAFYNLGIISQQKGQFDKAISNFNKAIDLNPDFTSALLNLGNAYRAINNLDEAALHYKKLIEKSPESISAINNLGVIYQEKGDVEKAIGYFKQFLEKSPNNGEAISNIIDELQYACEWEEAEEYFQKAFFLSTKALKTDSKTALKPFQSLRNNLSNDFRLKIARSWSPKFLSEKYSLKSKNYKQEKIHIAYISSDFKDHPIGHIFSNFINFHNHEKFQITCYSRTCGNQNFYDNIIRSANSNYIDLSKLTYKEAADRIYNDNVDLLIDLTGHTKGSHFEILAMKPAPLQISYLGFLGTSGAEYIDYIITDEIVTPVETQDVFSEKFAYLPDCYQVIDYSHLPSCENFSRENFNLPQDAIVFCSFNQPYKFEPQILSVWCNIMNRVNNSVLWLKSANQRAQKNIREFFLNNGISGDRILFSQRLDLNQHLKRLELADIALDTIIYNGGATTNNALWANLPVITLQGDSFVSRMSSSSLHALGVDELITSTPKQYEDLAVELAINKEKLIKIKNKIKEAKKDKKLFKVKDFVLNLEKIYCKMIEDLSSGKEINHIFL